MRNRPPTTRESVTHKAVIYAPPTICPRCKEQTDDGRVKFFFTVGYVYEPISIPSLSISTMGRRRPIELFLHMDESGGTLDGLCDSWAIATSLYWQCPDSDLRVWVEKFSHQEFLPKGLTKDDVVRFAQSIVDYVARWVGHEFLPKEGQPVTYNKTKEDGDERNGQQNRPGTYPGEHEPDRNAAL